MRLVLDSVKSTGGQELLRPEACGRERNTQPAPFKPWGSRQLKADEDGAPDRGRRSARAAEHSGRVQLRLPTRTEVVGLDHPKAGASVEKYGAIFTVTRVEGGTVSYQIAGARDRLLLFRALNGKGQPLASPSSFSSDFLFGDGVSGQKSYAGAIDRLEVVFAADEEAIELPFTLTDFAPAGKAGTVMLDRTPPFRPYSAQALQRDYPRRPSRDGARALRAVPRQGPVLLRIEARRHPAEPGGPELREGLRGRAAPAHPGAAPGRHRDRAVRDRGGEHGREDPVAVGERDSLRRLAQGRHASRPRWASTSIRRPSPRT